MHIPVNESPSVIMHQTMDSQILQFDAYYQ